MMQDSRARPNRIYERMRQLRTTALCRLPGTMLLVDMRDVQANLNYLLNEWDPIGVADLVSDEYDCLTAPLLSRLNAGNGRAEISEFLWHELEDHFGLDPYSHDVDGMADRLVAWWAAVGPEAAK
jgi:hypothetical protein